MNKKSFAWVLSVFLLVTLLCALTPAAYAESCGCTCVQSMDPACTCGCCAASAPSREDLLDAFIDSLFAAEDASDPFEKTRLYGQAESLWDAYLDTAYAEMEAEADERQPTREELFEAFMAAASDAEAEQDPTVRRELIRQAEILWDAFVETACAETEKDVYLSEESSVIGGSDGPTAIIVTDPKAGNSFVPGKEPGTDEGRDAFLDTASGANWQAQPENWGFLGDASAPEWMYPGYPGHMHERPSYSDYAYAPFSQWGGYDPWENNYRDDSRSDADADTMPLPDSFTGGQMSTFGMPNPWTETERLEDALLISGVDFCPPEEESLPRDMRLTGYRALPGTIEADYTNGEEELMLRASLDDEGYELSGDYNTYSHAWEENIGDVRVDCLGDGEHINVATFQNGDTAYALTMACGMEGSGLTPDELALLVRTMLPKSDTVDIYADPVDVYADPVDIYADPLPRESGAAEGPEAEESGEVVILFTGSVRCGVDEGIGLAGVKALRDSLEAQGCTTILADGGDALHGGAIGTLSQGSAIIDFMNALGCDVAIPGGHDFDYGVDRFLELAKAADFPYISCNIAHEGESKLEPYVILEAAGKRIAFIGVTAPAASEMPVQSVFLNEEGKAFIDFAADEPLPVTLQRTVDSALAEGADLICVLGYLGEEAGDDLPPCEELIAGTTGIDVLFEAHDGSQHLLKDAMGDSVVCVHAGSRLSGIGYVRLGEDGGIAESGVWSWPYSTSAPQLFGADNDLAEMVDAAEQKLERELDAIVTVADMSLSGAGEEIGRMETAIGNFCADALRVQSGADIGLISADYIRGGLESGEISYGDLLRIFPDNHTVRVIELTGRQLLDALEWGCRTLPESSGSFPQVSGLSFEIHTDLDSPCRTDENGAFLGMEGEYRVQNVLVNGEPLDPEVIYTLACPDAMILDYPAFMGAWIIEGAEKPDVQVLIDYIIDDLSGVIDERWAAAEQPRITITDGVAEAEETQDPQAESDEGEDIYLSVDEPKEAGEEIPTI